MRLRKVSNKSRNLTFRKPLHKLFTNTFKLPREYKILGGTWIDQTIAEELFITLPPRFNQEIIAARKQFRVDSNDAYSLADLKRDFQLVDQQFEHNKNSQYYVRKTQYDKRQRSDNKRKTHQRFIKQESQKRPIQQANKAQENTLFCKFCWTRTHNTRTPKT